jgi:diguanylate cyclase (GGDEF)-like protein
VYGFDEPGDGGEIVFRKGEGISWIVAETGQYLLVPDTAVEPRYLYFKGRQKNDGVCLSVPMLHKGRCVGVLNFLRPHGYLFMKEEIDFLSSIANQVAVAIVNARLHQRTVELSITDTLTGVFNRRYFNRKSELEFDEARRYRSPVSVLMIDIDRFKLFNDLNGHTIGDDALKRVASILTANTRRVDIVSRYGGEEFCIMLPNTTKNRGFEVAEKLRKAVETEQINGGDGYPGGILTISVGVASFPGDGHDVSGVLDAADKALYHAKNTGRNRVVMHEPGMGMPPAPRVA